MPYYKLQNICDIYKEPSTAITSNDKYNDPFTSKTKKISYYNDDVFKLNSYKYNNNNVYADTKSYSNIKDSYKHYVDTLIDMKQKLLKEETQLIEDTKNELNKFRKMTSKDSSYAKQPDSSYSNKKDNIQIDQRDYDL